MTAPPTTRSVTAITIHCPVDRETLDLVAAGHFAAIRDDTALAAILSIVRADNPLGDFGLYRAVVELAAGWELFVPGPAATPTLGEAGAVTASPMVILTVHIPGDAPTDAILDAFHAILAAHPWETPVKNRCRHVDTSTSWHLPSYRRIPFIRESTNLPPATRKSTSCLEGRRPRFVLSRMNAPAPFVLLRIKPLSA